MLTVTDFRNDPEALEAFKASWEFDPVASGKFFGLRFTLRNGEVRCSQAYSSAQSAQRYLSRQVR